MPHESKGLNPSERMTPPMPSSSSSAAAALSRLPEDVWGGVLRCLTGWDALALAGASRATRGAVTGGALGTSNTRDWWRRRCCCVDDDAGGRAQRRWYAQQHSFAFRPSDGPRNDAPAPGSTKIPRTTTSVPSTTRTGTGTGPGTAAGPAGLSACFSVPSLFGHDVRAFSIELWLGWPQESKNSSISNNNDDDNDDDEDGGDMGIALGAGTPFHISPSWNSMFEPWVMVDAHRNLQCSVLTGPLAAKPQVARGLARGRWHHIVLTFDGAVADVAEPPPGVEDAHGRTTGEQRVYVNGELRCVSHGALSRLWALNSFVLLGSGCQPPRDPTTAAVDHFGRPLQDWHPFGGLIDDFRVWHTPLSAEDVGYLHRHPLDAPQGFGGPCGSMPPPPAHSWKALAAQTTPRHLTDGSIAFAGAHEARPAARAVGIPLTLGAHHQRTLMHDWYEAQPFCPDPSSSFAIELWFMLHPEDPARVWAGGVLLGAQSLPMDDPRCPKFFRQLILVDRFQQLHASVLDEVNHPIGGVLRPGRWYHLALRYSDGTQGVYLNGALIRIGYGALLRDWPSLVHMQFGTGLVTPETSGSPARSYSGWYGFHGRIREVRIWGPRLKERQFQAILEASSPEVVGEPRRRLSALGAPMYSLQRDGRRSHFQYVHCSRPSEGVCAVPRDFWSAPSDQDKPHPPTSLDKKNSARTIKTKTHDHSTRWWFKNIWRKSLH